MPGSSAQRRRSGSLRKAPIQAGGCFTSPWRAALLISFLLPPPIADASVLRADRRRGSGARTFVDGVHHGLHLHDLVGADHWLAAFARAAHGLGEKAANRLGVLLEGRSFVGYFPAASDFDLER